MNKQPLNAEYWLSFHKILNLTLICRKLVTCSVVNQKIITACEWQLETSAP